MIEPTQEQLQALWKVCVEWRDRVDPVCPESIYQSDSVALACPELATAVMEVIWYADRCDLCGEVSEVPICEKCVRAEEKKAQAIEARNNTTRMGRRGQDGVFRIPEEE